MQTWSRGCGRRRVCATGPGLPADHPGAGRGAGPPQVPLRDPTLRCGAQGCSCAHRSVARTKWGNRIPSSPVPPMPAAGFIDAYLASFWSLTGWAPHLVGGRDGWQPGGARAGGAGPSMSVNAMIAAQTRIQRQGAPCCASVSFEGHAANAFQSYVHQALAFSVKVPPPPPTPGATVLPFN